MKTTITIFIFLMISSLAHAQGTFIDELTGLKLDYTEDWKEDEYEDMQSLISSEGLIIISTIKTDISLSSDEIISTFKDDYSAFTRVFKNLISVSTISGYGKGIIGRQEAVYLDITTPSIRDNDTNLLRIYMLDVKPYIYTFSISPITNDKSFINRSEILLKNVIFSE